MRRSLTAPYCQSRSRRWQDRSRKTGGFVAGEGQPVARTGQRAKRGVDTGQGFRCAGKHVCVAFAKQAYAVVDPVRPDPAADQVFEALPDLRTDGVSIQRLEAVSRPGMIERVGNRPVGIDQRSIEVEDQAVGADGYSRSGATSGGDGRQPSAAACRFRLKRP